MLFTGRSRACRGRNVLLAGKAYEIPHDQEIAGKPHAADDVQLKRQPFACRCRRVLTIALCEARCAKLAQEFLRLFFVRRSENGEMTPLEIELERAAVCYLLAARHRIMMAGEEFIHLTRGPDVKLIAAVAHAVFVFAQPAGVDAQQHIVGGSVRLAQVMGIAGRHQRQA